MIRILRTRQLASWHMRAEAELPRADHLVVVRKELLRVTNLHDQISDAGTQGVLTAAATCARSLAATASRRSRRNAR